MSQLPPSHNDSFKRLLDEGYVLYRRGSYIVGHVPVLGNDGTIHESKLVDLVTDGPNGSAGPPGNHQFWLIGEVPHQLDGSELPLGGGLVETELFGGEKSSRQYSFKIATPDQPGGREYVDFYEKFSHYFSQASAPVKHLFPEYQLTNFEGVLSEDDPENPFVFSDNHAARAGIMGLRAKLLNQHVAVVGGGGTGGYVVDLLSKSPVGSIDIYDDDTHGIHNSFRWPSPTIREDLGRGKAELLASRYGRSHKFIKFKKARITEENISELDDKSFVFLCVDEDKSRKFIANYLIEKGIPFVDSGMGLNLSENGLTGMVRSSLFRPESEAQSRESYKSDDTVDVEDDYSTNIQTADLNALNAALSVMMFKKLVGYYAEFPKSWQFILTVSSGSGIRYDC